MLVNLNRLFSDALESKSSGTVKKVLSDLKDQGDFSSFESLLKKSTEIQQKTSDNVKSESEESGKDMDSLFSRVDGGVETGIRLSLPDFIKNKSDSTVSVPEAFVSAETSGGSSTSESGPSPLGLNDLEGSSEGKNSFAFALSSEPEKESSYKIADAVFSSAISESAEILQKKERGQGGYEDADSTVMTSQITSEEAVDESGIISSVSNSIKSQFVEKAPLESITSKKAERPLSGFISPAGELEIRSNMSDFLKQETVEEKTQSFVSVSEETSDSDLPRLVNDPEVLNLQVMNGVVTAPDRPRKVESSQASGRVEALSSVDMTAFVQVEDHLKDGVPLVESPLFPEVTKENPDVAEPEVSTGEVMSETVSQIMAGDENKLPYTDNSGSNETTSENKTEEPPVGGEGREGARFTDALSPESLKEESPSAFAGGSVKEGVESKSLDDIKESSLQESLSIMPDSGATARAQETRGLLQSIPLQKGPEALSDGVANVVKFINSRGETSAQVIVDPPAIGKVQIEIHATPDGMEANLRVDNVAVRDMIRNQLPLLQDMLAQQGISLSEMNVDVHSGDGSRGQWAEKNSSRRNSVDEGEDEDLEFTARIDLEQGLLVWTA